MLIYTNLTDFCLVILHLTIKFISTSSLILKYLIVKSFFDEIINSDFYLLEFLTLIDLNLDG